MGRLLSDEWKIMAEMKGKAHLNCPGILHEKRRVFMEQSLLRNGLNDLQYYHRIQGILPSTPESQKEG